MYQQRTQCFDGCMQGSIRLRSVLVFLAKDLLSLVTLPSKVSKITSTIVFHTVLQLAPGMKRHGFLVSLDNLYTFVFFDVWSCKRDSLLLSLYYNSV